MVKEIFDKIIRFFESATDLNRVRQKNNIAGRVVQGDLVGRNRKMSSIVINGNRIDVPDGANVIIKEGNIIVGGSCLAENIDANTTIQWEGPIGDVICHRSMNISGNVDGNIDAGGSVTCQDVTGSVDAGGSINCNNVGGDADAGGSIHCGNIGGDADAGGSIRHG